MSNKAHNFQIVGIKVKLLITNKDNNSAPFVFQQNAQLTLNLRLGISHL